MTSQPPVSPQQEDDDLDLSVYNSFFYEEDEDDSFFGNVEDDDDEEFDEQHIRLQNVLTSLGEVLEKLPEDESEYPQAMFLTPLQDDIRQIIAYIMMQIADSHTSITQSQANIAHEDGSISKSDFYTMPKKIFADICGATATFAFIADSELSESFGPLDVLNLVNASKLMIESFEVGATAGEQQAAYHELNSALRSFDDEPEAE